MRNRFVASLLLSPMLLSAVAMASQPKAVTPTPTIRFQQSTGVSSPQLIDANSIRIPQAELTRMVPGEGQVVLSLSVDPKGNARNVQVVQSVNQAVDARVLSAVRLARFHPAMLDNQPVSVDMEMTVVVRR